MQTETPKRRERATWRPYSTFRKSHLFDLTEYDIWMRGSSGMGSFWDEPEGFRVTDCYRLNGKWYHQTGIMNLDRKEINEANITHWMRIPKSPFKRRKSAST